MRDLEETSENYQNLITKADAQISTVIELKSEVFFIVKQIYIYYSYQLLHKYQQLFDYLKLQTENQCASKLKTLEDYKKDLSNEIEMINLTLDTMNRQMAGLSKNEIIHHSSKIINLMIKVLPFFSRMCMKIKIRYISNIL